MAEIFTREALEGILAEAALTAEQRAERVLALHGRALEDGYVSLDAARAAREAAVAEARSAWEQEAPGEAYRALRAEYDAYRAMQEARASADYARVKPKFFETVYGMVERGEGARPVAEQLADIRGRFEEFFTAGDGASAPAVVLPVGTPPAPAARMTLSEAMRRANAGERVDVGMIG